MTKEKIILPEKVIEVIKDALRTAPESQLSPELREKSISFFDTNQSLRAPYNYFVSISEQPITEASQFIKNLCDVKRFYQRPSY